MYCNNNILGGALQSIDYFYLPLLFIFRSEDLWLDGMMPGVSHREAVRVGLSLFAPLFFAERNLN